MTKQLWRKNWLRSINELTSLELQKNSWANINNDSYHRSFADFRRRYFQEVLLGIDYQFYIKEGWLTRKEFEIIKEWHNELELYVPPPNSYEQDGMTILSDKEWQSIVRFGMFTKRKLMIFISEKENKFLIDASFPGYSNRC